MKIIITESKINSTIYNFIDKVFASKDGDTIIFSLTALDENGKDVVGAYDFVNKDYYSDEGSDYLFSWTGEKYYESITPTYKMEKYVSNAPNVEIFDEDVLKRLDGYFGDLWKPVFKQWFKDKTGMDYKTLYT